MQATDESLIIGIMDAQPEAVIWLIPEWDDEHAGIKDFVLRYCNNTTLLHLNTSKEAMIGKKLSEIESFDEATRKIIKLQCSEVWESGEPMEITYYNDFVNRYFSVLRSKVLDGIISIARDITDRLNAEAALSKQAELLNGILNASINPIYACEAVRDNSGNISDLVFLKVNSKFLELSKRPEEDTIGKSYLSAFHSVTHVQLFDLMCKAIRNKTPLRQELFYTTDGKSSWYDFSLVPLGENGVVVSFTDITEIKQDKESIVASAQYLQNAIDSSQTGITVIVPVYDENKQITDFRYRVVNHTFSHYVGRTPDHLVGALLSKWFPLYKAQGTFDRYKKIFETGEPMRFDLHYVKDGFDVWVDVMAKKQGEEILVTFHDYTPLKKAQLAQEALVNDLKRSNANLEDFAFAASHDLQEPLRKIHFFSHKIRTTYADALDEEAMNMFNRMEVATHRMRDLINDLLDYSQTAQKPMETEKVDLNEVVQVVTSNLETTIQEKKAQITADRLPVIQGDQPQLTQLFQNLLSNSLKYCDPEKTPFISITSTPVAGRDTDFILPAENLNRPYNYIRITDNGIGFNQADAEKIFNVFQRLHGKSEYSGTGVGLAIVKKVIDNHNGYIKAESAPGEGAVFSFLLPA